MSALRVTWIVSVLAYGLAAYVSSEHAAGLPVEKPASFRVHRVGVLNAIELTPLLGDAGRRLLQHRSAGEAGLSSISGNVLLYVNVDALDLRDIRAQRMLTRARVDGFVMLVESAGWDIERLHDFVRSHAPGTAPEQLAPGALLLRWQGGTASIHSSASSALASSLGRRRAPASSGVSSPTEADAAGRRPRVVDYDTIAPWDGHPNVAAALAGNAPAFEALRGCQPYPAHTEDGAASSGLSPSRRGSAACGVAGRGMTYAYRTCPYDPKRFGEGRVCANFYYWYFPRDRSPHWFSSGHRHDWQGLVIWTRDEMFIGVAISTRAGFAHLLPIQVPGYEINSANRIKLSVQYQAESRATARVQSLQLVAPQTGAARRLRLVDYARLHPVEQHALQRGPEHESCAGWGAAEFPFSHPCEYRLADRLQQAWHPHFRREVGVDREQLPANALYRPSGDGDPAYW